MIFIFFTLAFFSTGTYCAILELRNDSPHMWIKADNVSSQSALAKKFPELVNAKSLVLVDVGFGAEDDGMQVFYRIENTEELIRISAKLNNTKVRKTRGLSKIEIDVSPFKGLHLNLEFQHSNKKPPRRNPYGQKSIKLGGFPEMNQDEEFDDESFDDESSFDLDVFQEMNSDEEFDDESSSDLDDFPEMKKISLMDEIKPENACVTFSDEEFDSC